MQQWEKAEAHYRAVVALGDVGNAHYDYGVLLGLQQKWPEAAAAYRLAIQVNPLNAPAHNNLGEALERQGQLDEALTAYRDAVTCEPEFRQAALQPRTSPAQSRTCRRGDRGVEQAVGLA